MIVAALKELYIETGRAALFDIGKMAFEDDLPVAYDAVLMVDEETYVLLSAQIAFLRKVQTDTNNIVGYSTDAMSITNADRPYANLSTSLSELEQKRRVLYYKMVRYTLL